MKLKLACAAIVAVVTVAGFAQTVRSLIATVASIDPQKHLWYAAMRIPLAAIDTRPPAPGNTLRLNLFRSQGPAEHLQEITWQPPMSKTFHVPEKFGLLKLVASDR